MKNREPESLCPPSLPERQTVVSQAAHYLEAELARGTWKTWLPNERTLCKMLHVSRGTLRSALQQLAASGRIRAEHGRGTRILTGQRKAQPVQRIRVIGLLSPQPLEKLRPTQTLWIDELRALLAERGYKIQFVHGAQYFRVNPANTLKKLVQQHACNCWLLIHSGGSTQNWFQQSKTPCVIAGSASPGVDLPFVDLDHFALCRHAAGSLLRLGHRRVAFVSERTGRAGETASEEGFKEGIRSSNSTQVEPIIVSHEGTPDSLGAALRRLMLQVNRPTALLVANPHFYLTVTSRLAQMGLHVPQDVSVISRDEDPFLSFILPRPARYAVPPRTFAKKLMRPLLELSEGRITSGRAVKITPHFLRGESVRALLS